MVLENFFYKVLPVFFSLLVVVGCENRLKGRFGWSGVDNRGIAELERNLLVQTEFRMGQEQLYFYEYETIWWVFQVTSGAYRPNGFMAALYENNFPTQPVEIDLRQVPVLTGGSVPTIRQYYEPLDPGKYVLVIAHDAQVVEQAEFHVVPPEGPSAPLFYEGENRSTEENEDDILRYSS